MNETMSAHDKPTDDGTTHRSTNSATFTLKLGTLSPNVADALVDGSYSLAKGDDEAAADAFEDAAARLRGGTN